METRFQPWERGVPRFLMTVRQVGKVCGPQAASLSRLGPHRDGIRGGALHLQEKQMLLVVTARIEGKRHADNHIADSECVRMFCGDAIPLAVMECGLNDVRNPYVGRGRVTCTECISEHANGRRAGYREP